MCKCEYYSFYFYFFKLLVAFADPSTADYCWRLKEGFVAAECLAVYKAVCSRPNLIDNHLSLLLSTFITYGILEVSHNLQYNGCKYSRAS